MTAAHGGYGSEQVPLGGGAAICERLCAAWAGREDLEVTLLSPGPQPPPGVRYLRVDVLEGRAPSSLGELAYAGFCRRFEAALTGAILRERPDVVLTHDLSEGPTFSALGRYGIPCVPILHVDVADFFCRMYLGERVTPWRAEALMRALRPWPLVPDVLRLVFEKQAEAAAACPHLVVPSQGMAGILEREYPDMPAGRVAVVPWGAPDAIPEADPDLAARLELPEGVPVIATLSRISPEKGQDVLLRALARAEERGEIPEGLTLVICGQAAYMQGHPFLRRLRAEAARLRQVRVLFPGHLGGARKRALLERADLFVSASRHESYGLTTMEAMAAGTPVVAVDTPGSRETVTPDSGRLVPDGEALWPALRGLLADPAERARLSEGARRRGREVTFSGAARRLLELLRSVRRPAGSPPA